MRRTGSWVVTYGFDQFLVVDDKDPSKGWGRGVLEFLDPGLASRIYGDGKPAAGPQRQGSETIGGAEGNDRLGGGTRLPGAEHV